MNDELKQDLANAYRQIDQDKANDRIKVTFILGIFILAVGAWIYGMAHVTTEITHGINSFFGVEQEEGY